ncbi:chemotaxis protein CheA [Sphingobium nicotianae]|uniref:Chemotaxis protein CheA n=1 Tax=Sphingobium nicotianae TaxID=2782607 RepID=A0A9X1ISS7_9SPHN|nr:chemotaxis protein CheA [Sphingobium nicotianae]MBT2188896.1 chemotaxis protein CheA [Sphingobium nicotianae]
MDEILGEFIAETLETLETLSGEIVAWEADPSESARLDAFFRFFHTVKGSCGFLNLPRFERLAHCAEDVLAAVRRGERIADPATVSAVLAVMDRIGALARSIGEEEQIPESEDDALLDALSMNSGGFEIFAPLPVATPTGDEIAIAPAEDEDEVRVDTPVAEAPTRRSSDGGSRERAPRTIRLPLALIDQLMNGISDMVLARNDLARKMRDHGVGPDLEGSFERLSANVADLRDMISKTRMQRVDRLYAAIPRMVRDLTRELGKKATLELDGGDVEMDREMVEMVVDPLTHIVRNALDHGVEAPADRIAAGKSEAGTLRIVARQSGNQIVIEISDDGRGINRAALVEKAIAARLFSAAEASLLSDGEKLNLIFHPGLSTAAAVTSISGRGVGMDVVRANIEQIGGVIGVTSAAGQGTTITMRVPLTLTIIPGLIVRSGALFFAMPRGNVVELLHQNSSMIAIETIGGARIATIRGERYSLIELEDILGLERNTELSGPRTLMVVRSSIGQPYVLGVEAVDSNEELVIRPASPAITAAGVFAGMTLPDNGQPMLLLDAAGLAQKAELPLREADSKARPTAIKADADVRAETIQALVFCERDGKQRLLPLAVVDRVEDLDAGQITISDGIAFARIDGRLMPALNTQGAETGTPKSLRLHDGHEQISYLIEDVVDIIEVPRKLDAQLSQGRIAGLVMVGDTQLEMIDPFAVFAEAAGRRVGAGGTRPIQCLIADAEDPWMRNILAPLLLQAGHDVSFGAAGDGTPDIILCSDEAAVCAAGDVPVLALREVADPAAGGPASIYRYDRETIMAAIAQAVRRAA